jgi:hypothetical protein
MFARFALTALAVALAAAGAAPAAMYSFTSANPLQQSVLQEAGSDGFLDFRVGAEPVAPFSLTAGGSTQTKLLTRNTVNPGARSPSDDLHNATLNYNSLIIAILNPALNEEGTIDLGGVGAGGIRNNGDAFIEDSFSATVNGRNVSAFGDTTFSIAFSNGTFLNVRLFDPNPNFEDFTPNAGATNPGISGEFSESRTALYSTVVQAQAPGVPEPATLSSLGIGGLLLAARAGLRRKRSHKT